MGNPLYSDDKGKMCWNAAKSWQVGWYDSNKFTFGRQEFVRRWIVGIADFDNNPDKYTVITKVETGTTNDLFIAFNRAKGVNSDNDEADNEVTIVEAGKDGEGYSVSRLKAHLVQGESYKIWNWRGSGNTLTITAEIINITADPGFARISISIPCTEKASDQFFFKWRRNPRRPVFKSCMWLSKRNRSTIQNICKRGGNGGGGKRPARDVCFVTCNTCNRRFL